MLIAVLGTFVLTEIAAAQVPNISPPPQFEDARAKAAGIRKLTGRHITLFTDLPPSEEVDALPAVFDAAVPLWAAYFKIAPERLKDWRMQGYLMADRETFRAIGMWPTRRAGVGNGFSIDRELWVVEQPTPYYRRHLLLHEGTHGFMNTLLGGCGPGWYMEGVAELLATHRWDDHRLSLGIMPPNRESTRGLGRIRLIRDAFAANRARSLPAVLATDNARALDNEAYAWCWALAKFLDSHPRYRDRFRILIAHVREPDFAARFRRIYEDDWAELGQEWRLFVGTLDHNYEIERTAIDFTPGTALPKNQTVRTTVAADQGWQSTGLWLETGKKYRISASGKYVVGNDPKPWPCEPNGVTIEYYRSRPLGMLIGTVYSKAESGKGNGEGKCPFLKPFPVGLETTVTPEISGTLYLKINESPSGLGDNEGALNVEVARIL